MEKLSGAWPAYAFLNELNINELDTEVLDKMNAVFQHLLNQRNSIKHMVAENAELEDVITNSPPDGAAKHTQPRSEGCTKRRTQVISAGLVLDLYWTCIGPVLDLYWTCIGPVLNLFWTCIGPVLDM